MAIVEDCCCCSLRAGSIVTGFLCLILSASGSVLAGVLVFSGNLENVLQESWRMYNDFKTPLKIAGPNGTSTAVGYEPLQLNEDKLLGIEAILLGICVFLLACAVSDLLLIVGAARDSPMLMIPWMVVQWIVILLTIVFLALAIWMQLVLLPKYWWVVMFTVGVVIVMVLAFVLVLSDYQYIRDRIPPEYYQGAELVHRQIWLTHNGKSDD
ncbi:uncharacterized protein LOC143036991 [Oratosquilla oratoria]|uniref:uncharacterized protein LOC143036991 n=1 Tax=Oratosquilla oratoria TaxID=337810 RepID=UPI003F776B77